MVATATTMTTKWLSLKSVYRRKSDRKTSALVMRRADFRPLGELVKKDHGKNVFSRCGVHYC